MQTINIFMFMCVYTCMLRSWQHVRWFGVLTSRRSGFNCIILVFDDECLHRGMLGEWAEVSGQWGGVLDGCLLLEGVAAVVTYLAPRRASCWPDCRYLGSDLGWGSRTPRQDCPHPPPCTLSSWQSCAQKMLWDPNGQRSYCSANKASADLSCCGSTRSSFSLRPLRDAEEEELLLTGRS